MEQQPNENPDIIRVTVGQPQFEHMAETIRQAYGKEVDALSYDEAMFVIGSYFEGAASNLDYGTVEEGDRTILDSNKDGKDAVKGYVNKMTEQWAPRIDDERELILNVVRKPTLWETIRSFNREGRLVRSYHYRGESPDLAS
jgi:hypothetical protein